MYEKVNISENTLRIAGLFTHGFENEYYIREIQRLMQISPRTAQLVLNDLEEKGILKSKLKGKIRIFKLRPSYSTKRYLVLVEQYKLLAFLQNKLLIKEVIEKISPHVKGIGIIFGSYAKGLEKKESDLDIFVAGTCSLRDIEKIGETFGMDVSVKSYPLKTFQQKHKNDIFLQEVIKNHVVFRNAELFIDSVFHNE